MMRNFIQHSPLWMEAETYSEELQTQRSILMTPKVSSILVSKDETEILNNNNNLRYTSLKDIICDSPKGYSTLLFYEGNEAFDSNITFKNELVKRAASVYLQSAALLATRNQNSFLAFWERLKRKVDSCSSWIRASLWHIFHFLNRLLGTFRPLPRHDRRL